MNRQTTRPIPTDSLDAYLAELADALPIGRDEEVRLAQQIEAAERDLLGVILQAHVALPGIDELLQGIRDRRRSADEVLGHGCRPGSAGRRWLIGQLEKVQALEQQHAQLRQAQKRATRRDTKARQRLHADIERNRRERSAVVRETELGRGAIEMIVARLRAALETLRGAERSLERAEVAAGGRSERAVAAALRQAPVEADRVALRGAAGAMREARDTIQRIEAELGRPARSLRALRPKLDRAKKRVDALKGELTRSNLRLVVLFAKQHRHRGLALGDLIQEGNLALMRAADKYDYRVGTRFSTYAAWWIRQAMTRATLGQRAQVRVPVRTAELIHVMQMATHRLGQRLGREPTVEEIAEAVERPVEDIQRIRHALPHMLSLDAPLGEEEGDRSWGELVADETQEGTDERVQRTLERDRTRRVLQTLPPREQRVLRMRFGMDGEREHTLQEIGNELHLSRERIRQIEARALRMLRETILEQTGRASLESAA